MGIPELDTKNEEVTQHVDWDKAYNSEIFKKIVKKRYGFVIPALLIYIALFLIQFAIGLKKDQTLVLGNLNTFYLYTLILYPVLWGAAYWFTKYSNKHIYPLEDELVKEFGKVEKH